MSSALEKREPRGGLLHLLGVVAVFLPSIGTCGGLGAYKAHIASSRVADVSIEDVADASRTPAGTFVATDARLRVVARDHLPYDDTNVIDARGATLFSVDGSKTLVVYCEDSACDGLDGLEPQVHVRGQLCSGDEHFLCTVPKPLDLYLRREAHLGRRHRVVLAGATPNAVVWEAALTLGIALLLMVVAAVTVIVKLRARSRASTAGGGSRW